MYITYFNLLLLIFSTSSEQELNAVYAEGLLQMIVRCLPLPKEKYLV
jgi:hypothetical protein